MNQCAHCGFQNSAEGEFCENCGNALAALQPVDAPRQADAFSDAPAPAPRYRKILLCALAIVVGVGLLISASVAFYRFYKPAPYEAAQQPVQQPVPAAVPNMTLPAAQTAPLPSAAAVVTPPVALPGAAASPVPAISTHPVVSQTSPSGPVVSGMPVSSAAGAMPSDAVTPGPAVPLQPVSSPPSPASAAQTKYNGPLSGVVVWTGTLNKNDSLTIDGPKASTGVLRGEFPGAPIDVQVDSRNLGLVEQPAASNGWRRLVLLSHGSVSSLVIHWRIRN